MGVGGAKGGVGGASMGVGGASGEALRLRGRALDVVPSGVIPSPVTARAHTQSQGATAASFGEACKAARRALHLPLLLRLAAMLPSRPAATPRGSKITAARCQVWLLISQSGMHCKLKIILTNSA